MERVQLMELNRVYKLHAMDLLAMLPNESIDLCYTAPPFNTRTIFQDFDDRNFTTQGTIPDSVKQLLSILKDKGQVSYLSFMSPILSEIHRVLKPTGSFYLHCDDNEMHYLKVVQDMIFGKVNYKNTITWQRSLNHNDSKSRYSNLADYLVTFGQGGLDTESVLEMGKKQKPIYSTKKPEALLERIIKCSSKEGDVILDCFCGSGTTAVVAKKLNRNYIVGDISDEAIAITNSRLV
jgi:site-specific DNA-methyltransferase (adenine-specific)